MNARDTKGIIYVSTGHPSFARMCLKSIASLRDWGYRDHVLIITDQTGIRWPKDRTEVRQVPRNADAYSSRDYKTQVGLLTPFQRNVFLDCDILATSDLSSFWDQFPEEAIGLTPDLYPTLHQALVAEDNQRHFSSAERLYTQEKFDTARPYFNAGFISWTNTVAARQFFTHWHAEWKRFAHKDQMAMARALQSSGIPIHELSETFNARSALNLTVAQAINNRVTFVHFWDDKKAFYLFARELKTFKTLDAPTQSRLQSFFAATPFRHRHALKRLPQEVLRTPFQSLRLLVLLYRSLISLGHNIYPKLRRALFFTTLVTTNLVLKTMWPTATSA